MATNYADLVPASIANDAISAATQQSVVLTLGRTIRMPSGVESVPIVSVAPAVSFVTPAYGGRKPITQIEWSAERLEPVEIACTLAIPDAFIDDTGFPVWESVRGELANAIAKLLDQAVLFGTNAPAAFPAGGIAALAGTPQSGTTAEDAIDKALTAVEAQGVRPSGIASGLSILAALRKAQISAGMGPVAAEALPSLFGLPIATTVYWDASKGDALVGDWAQLLVGIREDVTFDLSSDGVLVDPAGDVVVSAFQDDQTLARIYLRVAVAVAQPVGPGGSPIVPFEFADWTAAALAAEETSSRTRRAQAST
jgi:HK97 family phage major capsid protein